MNPNESTDALISADVYPERFSWGVIFDTQKVLH